MYTTPSRKLLQWWCLTYTSGVCSPSPSWEPWGHAWHMMLHRLLISIPRLGILASTQKDLQGSPEVTKVTVDPLCPLLRQVRARGSIVDVLSDFWTFWLLSSNTSSQLLLQLVPMQCSDSWHHSLGRQRQRCLSPDSEKVSVHRPGL